MPYCTAKLSETLNKIIADSGGSFYGTAGPFFTLEGEDSLLCRFGVIHSRDILDFRFSAALERLIDEGNVDVRWLVMMARCGLSEQIEGTKE